MAHAAMVGSYLGSLLRDAFGEELRSVDGTYVLPLPGEPAAQVLLGGRYLLRVRVWSVVVTGVDVSVDLLRELNALNAVLPYGRVYLDDDVVVAEDTILGDALEPELLDNAIRFVSWVAEAHGPDLARRFGGDASGAAEPSPPGTNGDAGDLPVTGSALAEAGATSVFGTAAPAMIGAAGYL